MANFKIGNRVRVIVFKDAAKTGVIVDKGKPHVVTSGDVVPWSDIQIFWWKVKLDVTDEEEEFPDIKLEKIE